MALSSRHLRKASLCKQTAYYNSTSLQAKTQSAVTASKCVCMTFLSSYSSTILTQAQTSSWSQSAWCPQVSQSISVFRKRCQESFFTPLSFGGFEALFKGALMLLPQCNSKVLINFLASNNIYRVWTGGSPALAETTEK